MTERPSEQGIYILTVDVSSESDTRTVLLNLIYLIDIPSLLA